MAQYIDKDALVAEIERQLSPITKRLERDKNDPWEQDLFAAKVLHKLLSFIDTLEVKEVNLENKNLTWKDMMLIHKCIKDAMNKYLYAFQTIEGQKKVYEDVLKRFKAQKGE